VRERQILVAAVAAFARAGYGAASMDDIAAAAGISKPMVYAYLGTKDELFLACLHQEGTRLMEAIVAAVAPDLSPQEQLWRGLHAFFGYVSGHRDGWCVLYRQARGREPFAAEVARMRVRLVEVVTGLLTRAAAGAGAPHRDVDVSAIAYALVGAGESLADWAVDHPEPAGTTATRLMGCVWLGAADLLRGATWRGTG